MDDVLRAREVLVPADTLHDRVLARFQVDPRTFGYLLEHWKSSRVLKDPSKLGSDLEPLSFVNRWWNDSIKLELTKCQDDKLFYCYRIKRLVKIAENVVLQCHLSNKATERGLELDLLELARSFVGPLDEAGEWPILKDKILDLSWKTRNRPLKKVRNCTNKS